MDLQHTTDLQHYLVVHKIGTQTAFLDKPFQIKRKSLEPTVRIKQSKRPEE
jgi:hypothetical protein